VGHQPKLGLGVEPHRAVGEDQLAAQADGDPARVDAALLAAQELARRRDQPADVGVVAVHGALEERRVHHRLAQAAGQRRRRRPLHRDPDDVVDPLAVADHVLGQVAAHLAHGPAQRGGARAGQPAGGEGQHAVGDAGVAVDADVLEAVLDRLGQPGAQLGPGDGHVGEEEHQHGGQVGLDHPRPLGDAHQRAALREVGPADLGVEVGGHDGLGGRQHAPILERRRRGR
jgi:hypothetical protein